MPGDSDGLAGVGGQATRISSFIMLAGKPEQGWVALAGHSIADGVAMVGKRRGKATRQAIQDSYSIYCHCRFK
jgi:hypothetical protein